MYAARFPAKVRKLALAGAPIDIGAGESKLSDMAQDTPMRFYNELVELGQGRVLGPQLLQCSTEELDGSAIHHLLQSAHAIDSAPFRDLESRFQNWYASTLDLPGTYYLQVVQQLFKENRLAGGREFRALGRRIELSSLECPLFVLAAEHDVIVAPEQNTVPSVSSINARLQKPPRHAVISACSWAERCWLRCGPRSRIGCSSRTERSYAG